MTLSSLAKKTSSLTAPSWWHVQYWYFDFKKTNVQQHWYTMETCELFDDLAVVWSGCQLPSTLFLEIFNLTLTHLLFGTILTVVLSYCNISHTQLFVSAHDWIYHNMLKLKSDKIKFLLIGSKSHCNISIVFISIFLQII